MGGGGRNGNCTAYESGGVSHSPVESTKEGYAATIVYENAEAKTVETIPVKGPTMAAVNTAVTQITGNATITGAMGAGVSASRDSSGDTFSKTLKCHASNGHFLSPIRNSISPPRGRFYPDHARDLGGHRHGSGLKITSLFQKAAEMKWNLVLCMVGGMVVLGICGADLISSSILCDGATWTSSAVTGPDRTYGASLPNLPREHLP